MIYFSFLCFQVSKCLFSLFCLGVLDTTPRVVGEKPSRTVPHSNLEILTSAHFKYVINFFLPELKELACTSQSHYLECKYVLLVVARHELTEG